MEEKNPEHTESLKAKKCDTPLCRIMIPVMVILILGFGAVSLIDAYYHVRGKNFVVLEQQGVEIQRISIEPWKDKTTDVPIWYEGSQHMMRIEVNRGAARLLQKPSGRYYERTPASIWIHDLHDVYTYEPLKLKLYFE